MVHFYYFLINMKVLYSVMRKLLSIKNVLLWLLRWLSSKSNHLPMQETQVWSLIRGDPTSRTAAKPVCRSYWVCALEPGSQDDESPCGPEPVPTRREASTKGEKPPQKERSLHKEKPVHEDGEWPLLPAIEESPLSNKGPTQPKMNK